MNKKNQTNLIVCFVILATFLIAGVIWQRSTFPRPDSSQSMPKANTLQDGIDCFQRGEYAKAKDIFTKFSGSETAAGYIGIMQMYGLGGYQHDVVEAQKNLELAPNTTPFLVPKADLTLILDLYLSYCVQSKSLNRAKDLYEIALSENPDDKAVMLRLNALKGITSASGNWDNYSFTTDNGTEGVYSGQIRIGNNWTKTAHGWGCFAWDDHSSWMGKFANLKLNGSGLGINRKDYTDRNEYSFTFSAGQFKNDKLIEGVLIDNDGKQYFGTFKNGVIDNCTEVRDVLGKVQ